MSRPDNIWPYLNLLRDGGIFLISAGAGVWAWIRKRQAPSWPTAQGSIIWTKTEELGRDQNYRWVGELTYSYIVEGEYYSGFHHLKARGEERAARRVEGWKDRIVIVRYSPRNHAISLLLKADQPGGQLGN